MQKGGLIPALRRLRQVDNSDFEASLVYYSEFYQPWLYSEIVSQK